MPESTTALEADSGAYHQIHFAWAEPTLLGRVGPGPAATSLPDRDQPVLRSWRDRLIPALTADYRSALPGTDPAAYPETLWAHHYPDGQSALVYRWPGDVREAHAWAIVGPTRGLTFPRVLSLHENPNTRPAASRPPTPGWATMRSLSAPAPWERTAAPGALRTRDRRAAETQIDGEPILVGAVAHALAHPDRPVHLALDPDRADLWQAVQLRFLWGMHRTLHDVLTPRAALPAAGWSWSFSTYDPVLGAEDGPHLAFAPPPATHSTGSPHLSPVPSDHLRIAEGLVTVLREEGGDALADHLRERGIPEATTFGERRDLLRDWLDPAPRPDPQEEPDEPQTLEQVPESGVAAEEDTAANPAFGTYGEPWPLTETAPSPRWPLTGVESSPERPPLTEVEPAPRPTPLPEVDSSPVRSQLTDVDPSSERSPLTELRQGPTPSRLTEGEPSRRPSPLVGADSAPDPASDPESDLEEAPDPFADDDSDTAEQETWAGRLDGSTGRRGHTFLGVARRQLPQEPEHDPLSIFGRQPRLGEPDTDTARPTELEAASGDTRLSPGAGFWDEAPHTTEPAPETPGADPEPWTISASTSAPGPVRVDRPEPRSPEDAPPLALPEPVDYAAETVPEPDEDFDDPDDNWPTQYADLPLSRLERWHSKRGPEGAHTDVVDARAAVRAERAELQRVRDERDHYHTEVQELRREIARLDQSWIDAQPFSETPERNRRWPLILLVLGLAVAALVIGLEVGSSTGTGLLGLLPF
ncbi:hypothetical protein [Nocardiopsis sp. SBT366]|uniref:hypothetical protein n=1 Tax=Nocardiopsis sp. SBT366 TaxID=1580529 RepID=UPI00066D80C7|nr:hypothetical protein [Nocardiopsis sp. SBT366]